MGSNVAVLKPEILPMTDKAIANVRKLEMYLAALPQIDIETTHVLHGGMYSRTIKVPAGNIVTGSLTKIPTILIAQGNVIVYIGEKAVELDGYNVIPASANRKQAVITKSDAYFTMIFPTNAKTVEEAESEFTDEATVLMSRRQPDFSSVTVTGE